MKVSVEVVFACSNRIDVEVDEVEVERMVKAREAPDEERAIGELLKKRFDEHLPEVLSGCSFEYPMEFYLPDYADELSESFVWDIG